MCFDRVSQELVCLVSLDTLVTMVKKDVKESLASLVCQECLDFRVLLVGKEFQDNQVIFCEFTR